MEPAMEPAMEQLSNGIPLKNSFKAPITKKYGLVNEVINMKKKIETKYSQSMSFTECNDPISMSQEREERAGDDDPIQRIDDEYTKSNRDSYRALRLSEDGLSDPPTESFPFSDSDDSLFYFR